jgi:hypothetical protein
MPRITIEKYYPFFGEYWTNVYWTGGSMGDAGAVAVALIAAEVAVHYNVVTITKARIDDGLENTDVFVTSVVNAPGSRSPGAEPYPLFAVARVDFSISGQGRPGRKYLRGVLGEDTANGLALTSGMMTVLNTYASAVVAAGVTDPQGSAIISGAAHPQVAMRQLRRGSKKPVTP